MKCVILLSILLIPKSQNVKEVGYASTRNDALAAVMVPCGLMKAGFSFAILSIGEGRTPLSLVTGLGRPEKNKMRVHQK